MGVVDQRAASRTSIFHAALLGLLCLLAACANQGGTRVATGYYPARSDGSRSYPPPGPPEDPWGPYVVEASQRFSVPERWIRRVMRQESGGHAGAVSSAGAMGLMQVMPATYEILRQRYNLGDDPFDPHNNMLAGTAYLKEMYDKYGSPAFLAAYNAGPGRVDAYLAGGARLPDETVNYLASIAPYLGNEIAPSGPLAVFAQPGGARYAQTVLPAGSGPVQLAANGCDADAAYDPDRVCSPAPAPRMVATASLSPVVPTVPGLAMARGACDPDAAFDPSHPCHPDPNHPPPQPVMITGPCDPDAAYDPSRPCRPAPVVTAAPAPSYVTPSYVSPPYVPPYAAPVRAAPAYVPPAVPQPRLQLAAASGEDGHFLTLPRGYAPAAPASMGAGWAIQVGAFADQSQARDVADRVRVAIPDLLRGARVDLAARQAAGGLLYRARLTALSSTQASQSCARLSALQKACIVVPPGA